MPTGAGLSGAEWMTKSPVRVPMGTDDKELLTAADAAHLELDTTVEPDSILQAESKSKPRTLRILRWVGFGLAAILLVVTILAIWPASTSGLGSQATPTSSYDQAVEHFNAQTKYESGAKYELCESQLLTNGERTDVVVVMFHGLTNCLYSSPSSGNSSSMRVRTF